MFNLRGRTEGRSIRELAGESAGASRRTTALQAAVTGVRMSSRCCAARPGSDAFRLHIQKVRCTEIKKAGNDGN